jgi:hypothetical protein
MPERTPGSAVVTGLERRGWWMSRNEGPGLGQLLLLVIGHFPGKI